METNEQAETTGTRRRALALPNLDDARPSCSRDLQSARRRDTPAMKPEITLVYDADCPNLPAARVALREALEREGLEPQWVEYDRAAPGTPAPLLRFGSPTILVDGVDVAGEAGGAAAASCRVYPGERGLRGVPPVEAFAEAIAHRAMLANAPQISKSAASGALGLALVSALCWLRRCAHARVT